MFYQRGGLLLAFVGGMSLAACVVPSGPQAVPRSIPSPEPSRVAVVAATETVIAAPTTVATETSTLTPKAGVGQKVNYDEFLPPGRGRDLLIANCSTCHPFVCALRGQRTAEHWRGVKRSHKDKVSGLSEEDFEALFAYLADNFNDTKPEPELPPLLQNLGCGFGAQ
jgi:hypothetical protein